MSDSLNYGTHRKPAETMRFSSIQSRRHFFRQKTLYNLRYWRNHTAIETIDIAILDRSYKRILSAIAFGLKFSEGWNLTRELMIAFAPYMERRGYWEVWNQLLRKGIMAAKRQTDQDGEITLTALLARVCQRQSRSADTIRYYRKVMRLARKAGNQYEFARACSTLLPRDASAQVRATHRRSLR